MTLSLHTDLKNAIYSSLRQMIASDVPIIWMYGGGPAPKWPYIGIQILNNEQVGKTNTEWKVSKGQYYDGTYLYDGEMNYDGGAYVTQVKKTYSTLIRICFFGIECQDVGYDFDLKIDSQTYRTLWRVHGLSFQRKLATANVPRQYETQWVSCHQIDFNLLYYIAYKEQIDGIESVGVTINATQEDNSVITTILEIP